MWPKLGKEVETIFTRTEVLELKSIINEIKKKNSLDELNIRLKIEEDKVSEVEDRSIGITQCEEQRDGKKKKKKIDEKWIVSETFGTISNYLMCV